MFLLKVFPRILSFKLCVLVLLDFVVLCLLDYTPFRTSILPNLPRLETRQAQALISNATSNSTDSVNVENTVPISDSTPKGYCDSFSDTSHIQVVLKTGANEVFDKLPTQLLTMLQCVEKPLLFSDLEQDLGPHHIRDVLKNIPAKFKEENADFDYYRTLQEYKKKGQDIRSLKETTHDAAWNLDKYKFIRMLDETWRLTPNKKWYVFIEADTYLVWSNLLLWLERLDPEEPLYLGSPTYTDSYSFSHGGSGFILSGAALSKFWDDDSDIVARYDIVAQNEQFGDFVLMKALKERDIEFTHVWPMLQAETPSTIPYGPGPDNGVRHFCQPVITMHHITAEVASSIWSYELQRSDVNEPMLFGELYEHLIEPFISAEREDWYNLSDDIVYKAPGVEGGRQKDLEDMSQTEKDAHISFHHCGRACDEEPRCFQYVYFNNSCGFSYSYRLGESRPPDSDTSFKSGWNLRNIEKDKIENACVSPDWV